MLIREYRAGSPIWFGFSKGILDKKTFRDTFLKMLFKKFPEGFFRRDFFLTASTHRDTLIAHVSDDF